GRTDEQRAASRRDRLDFHALAQEQWPGQARLPIQQAELAGRFLVAVEDQKARVAGPAQPRDGRISHRLAVVELVPHGLRGQVPEADAAVGVADDELLAVVRE